MQRVSLFLAVHLFPLVSFHTDSGEIITALLVKCFNVSRIRLGVYHIRHHLKELGGELLFSMVMHSIFFFQKSDSLVKINVFNKRVFRSFYFRIFTHEMISFVSLNGPGIIVATIKLQEL